MKKHIRSRAIVGLSTMPTLCGQAEELADCRLGDSGTVYDGKTYKAVDLKHVCKTCLKVAGIKEK